MTKTRETDSGQRSLKLLRMSAALQHIDLVLVYHVLWRRQDEEDDVMPFSHPKRETG
jgi:hypothetical protein